MRKLFLWAFLTLGASHMAAQAATPSQPAASPASPALLQAGDSGRASSASVDTSDLSALLAARRETGNRFLPSAANFSFGNRTIAVGTRVDGPVAVARGDIDVYGTVNGDVIAIDGDVRVHRGARVTGDAWAAAGTVLIDGGEVDGRKRAIAIAGPVLPPASSHPPLTTGQAIRLVIGWFALLTIIGLGVMIFAETNIDGVVDALERGVARSFWIGLAGQFIALPTLVALVLALGITVIGVLLIPFAIVAYVIAVAGLVTLGFLAVARLTGGAVASVHGTTSLRGLHLRALIFGLAAYLGLWCLAAVFVWSPVAGGVLRVLAIAITWVAATVGLGATLSSRAGTKRPGTKPAGRAVDDSLAWQTPTPVSGVAAATRRVVANK